MVCLVSLALKPPITLPCSGLFKADILHSWSVKDEIRSLFVLRVPSGHMRRVHNVVAGQLRTRRKVSNPGSVESDKCGRVYCNHATTIPLSTFTCLCFCE